VPIRSWSYRVDPASVRHLGPTAQDFHAAFGLGRDTVTIAAIDEGGVALAAAQALDSRTRTQQQTIAAQQRTITAQQRRIDAQARELAELRRRMDRIEAALAAQGTTRKP
jgi:septal ring factor EnvC (AmiA/AmiB activator)